MIRELPDDWIQLDLSKAREAGVTEKEYTQWLLFNNATYVIGFGKISIQDPDIALMFRLTFGI